MPAQLTTRSVGVRPGRIALVGAAAVCAVVGISGLSGWVLGSAWLTGSTAVSPAIKVHAALAFVLLAVALGADGPQRRLARMTAAVLIVGLALLAAVELLVPTGTRWSSWPAAWTLDDGSVNGPMALNGAAAFLSLAVSLWSSGRAQPRWWLVALGASLAGAVAAAAALGYLLDVESVRSWNVAEAMTVPATIAFLAAAGAVLQVSWLRDSARAGPPSWLPLPVAVLALATILLVWRIVVEVPAALDGRSGTGPTGLAAGVAALTGAAGIGSALHAWQRASRVSYQIAETGNQLRAERDARAASQAQLEVARAALAAVVDQAPVGIVLLTAGPATTTNAEAVRLLGSTEASRPNLEALAPLDDGPALATLLDEVARHGTPRVGRYQSVDDLVLEVRVVSVRGDADGLLVLLVDVTLDHDARRHLATALAREQAAVQELRRVDELRDVFLSAVSHELRTPLTVISGGVATLGRSAPELGADDRDVLVAAVARNAERLTVLLSDLLDLDRIRRRVLQPVREPIELGALVRAALEELDLGSRHVAVEDLEGVVLAVDHMMVTRILVNLVTNALRHTSGPAPIVVRVSRAGDDGVRIEVEDDGPGVSDPDKQRIFGPFQQGTTGRAGVSGIGIGLNLVLRFAELHEGRAWVEDVPGGGARFVVQLPHTPVPPAGPGPSERAAAGGTVS